MFQRRETCVVTAASTPFPNPPPILGEGTRWSIRRQRSRPAVIPRAALCVAILYVRYTSCSGEVDGVTTARDIQANPPPAPALPPRGRTRRALPARNNQKIATLVHQRLRDDILSLAL